MVTFNNICNSIFNLVYSPMAGLPPWASLGVISGVIGVVMLLAYKYTSWQSQIGRARDEIKARMLAMKLFKDNIGVALGSQVGVMWSSFKILMLSVPPILVAMIPMVPLLAQLAGRYAFAPLPVGKTSDVKVFLSDAFAAQEQADQADVRLEASEGVTVSDRWRSPDSKEIWWRVKADTPGVHQLSVVAGNDVVTKDLPVGDYRSITAPISPKRTCFYTGMLDNPLMMPWEPMPSGGAVRAIEITGILNTPAPDVLPVWLLGNWIIYFLIVSIIFALIVKPVFNVKI